MEQDGLGTTKFTIWQPSRMQGLVSIDDGLLWYTYMPMHKQLMTQESPRVGQGNPAYQIALADQNYTWKQEKSADIAECPTICITATPKSKDLNTRRYYLDSRTNFMLRTELINPDGRKTVQLDTRSIAYLKSFSKITVPGLFDEGVKKVNLTPPMRLSPVSTAKDLVGFIPIIPDKLPYGFIVKSVEAVGPPNDRLIAIRLTDGLVMETIYQFKPKKKDDRGKKDRFRFGREVVTKSGIRMRALGDLPETPANRLLDTFTDGN
jgi:hypothetical protein